MSLCTFVVRTGKSPEIKAISFRATITIQSQQPTPWEAPWLLGGLFCFLNSAPEWEGEDNLCIYKVVGNSSSISWSQETCHHFRILCLIWQGQRKEDYSVLWDGPKENRKHRGENKDKSSANEQSASTKCYQLRQEAEAWLH